MTWNQFKEKVKEFLGLQKEEGCECGCWSSKDWDEPLPPVKKKRTKKRK